jgi:hypothetical protein
MRESGVGVDKIVLMKATGTPTPATGPAESARE